MSKQLELRKYSLRLGKGSKKKQIIHILLISVLHPPPLSTPAKVNNTHTKEFFIHISWHPPTP